MPAITSLTIATVAGVGRVLVTLGRSAGRALRRCGAWWRNRRDAIRLADCDERMLADIGLTRSDLRDAYSEPLWRDPTVVLARRSAERRSKRHEQRPNHEAMSSAPCYPPLDRPARLIV